MSELTFVIPESTKKWDAIYASGSDKKYPNLDLVRLDMWHFGRPGRLLEYAFGCGENLIHLLERGHVVDALDASLEAKNVTQRKLDARPDIRDRATLHHINESMIRLPFEDAVFDFVNCLSVLSLLGSRARIEHLLAEFARVLKPGGKIIVDINGPQSDFARLATPLGDDVYETRGHKGDEPPHLSYCPKDAQAFAEIVRSLFVIDDVGYSSHGYFHSEIQEFLVCAHRA